MIFMESSGEACQVMRQFSTFRFRDDDYQLRFWYTPQHNIDGNKSGSGSSTPASQPSRTGVGAKPNADSSKAPSSTAVFKKLPLRERWVTCRNKELFQALNAKLAFQLTVKVDPTDKSQRDQTRLVLLDILNSKCSAGLEQMYEVVGKEMQPMRFFLIYDSVDRSRHDKEILTGWMVGRTPTSPGGVPISTTVHLGSIGLKTPWTKVPLEELSWASTKLVGERVPNPTSAAQHPAPKLAAKVKQPAPKTSKAKQPAPKTSKAKQPALKPAPKVQQAAPNVPQQVQQPATNTASNVVQLYPPVRFSEFNSRLPPWLCRLGQRSIPSRLTRLNSKPGISDPWRAQIWLIAAAVE